MSKRYEPFCFLKQSFLASLIYFRPFNEKVIGFIFNEIFQYNLKTKGTNKLSVLTQIFSIV